MVLVPVCLLLAFLLAECKAHRIEYPQGQPPSHDDPKLYLAGVNSPYFLPYVPAATAEDKTA